MRRIGLILGWLLLLAALGVLVWEILGRKEGEAFSLRPAGQFWYGLDSGSLNLTQAVIERYLWPPLWDPVILSVLQLPAIVVIGVPGLLIILASTAMQLRRKRRKRRFR